MGRYLKAMNLPNREEIVNLDKRLDAIELELPAFICRHGPSDQRWEPENCSHKTAATNKATASGKVTDERRYGSVGTQMPWCHACRRRLRVAFSEVSTGWSFLPRHRLPSVQPQRT